MKKDSSQRGLTALRYVAATGLWALGWAARHGLIGILPPQGFPFLTFFPAVMLAAYFFGLGPGLLCAGLSVAAAYLSFIPHDADGVLGLARGDLMALVFFSAILVVDCLILHLLSRSRQLAAEREQDLRELTNNSPDILTRFDRDYRHLFVSGAIVRLTGKPTAAFIGRTNRELGMPAALCDQWEDALASVFREGQPVSLRFEFGGKVFAATLVPEFTAGSGAVKSVLGVTRDVTEIDRHERALEAHDQLKDQMLATVAHELRNPLTTFSAGVDLLERLPDPPAAVQRATAAMRRQTTQMSRLVGDLMDLTRIRANLVDLTRSTVDLGVVLQSAVEVSQQMSDRRAVAIELRLPPEQGLVEGDPGRLIQVFANLLTNAIKFSPEGGQVIVQAHWSPTRHSVSVIDQGAGIEAHMLDTVFELFVQSPSGRSLQSGLGIGLALVKQLVRLHGGDVWARSDGLGRGATFTVELPARPQAGEGPAAAPSPALR